MTALAILSLISVLSYSGYHRWYQHKQFETGIQQFLSALQLAKRISILKNRTVYLCATQNQEHCDQNWQGEIVLFTASDPDKIDMILARFSALPANIHLNLRGFRPGAPYLYFMNNGESSNAGSLTFSNDDEQLIFTVSQTGIVRQDISG